MNVPVPASRRAGAALATLAAALLVTGALAGLRRVVVEGTSMLPTLAPGDRLLLRRAWRVRVGDLVAVPDPRRTGRLLVKRVAGRHLGQLELRGDNPAASTDSRIFGAVPRSSVRGRVIGRYAPPHRRGPVG